MQAAVGLAQLEKLPSFVARRRANFARLYDALQPVRDKLILPEACESSTPSPFGFLLTCKEGVSRERVVAYLEAHGVQTRMLFAGNLIKHPCFDELRRRGDGYRTVGDLPVTDRIMRDTFLVGVYPGLSDGEIDLIAQRIVEALQCCE